MIPIRNKTPVSQELLLQVGFKQVDPGAPLTLRLGDLFTQPEFTDREGNRKWWLNRNLLPIPSVIAPTNLGQLLELLDRLEL